MFSISHVTIPTKDTQHPLLLIQTNHGGKYLLGNIPEGTQRSIVQNHIRLSGLNDIFLTGPIEWTRIGGLPGLILTIADQGKNELKLYNGSKLLDYMISSWRYFMHRPKFKLNTNMVSNGELIFKDKNISIKSHILTAPFIDEADKNNETLCDKNINTYNYKNIIEKMFPKVPIPRNYDPTFDLYQDIILPEQDPKNIKTSTCYEVKFNSIRGKFNLQNAIKLGVPKGPLFAKLAKGETVTLENGDIVTPEQVLGDDRYFPKMLILDIPDESFLTSCIKKFSNSNNISDSYGGVFYLLGSDVPISNTLISLMELFGTETQHYISHPNICQNDFVFHSSVLTTLKLKSLQRCNYNLPRNDSKVSKPFYDCFNIQLPTDKPVEFHNEENPEVLQSKIPHSNIHVINNIDTLEINAFSKTEKRIIKNNRNTINDTFNWKKLYDDHIQSLEIPNASYENTIENEINKNYFNESPSMSVEIITLGTGSALPSKYRNVSSTLLKIPYKDEDDMIMDRYVMLDAGENTIGTLNRMFDDLMVKKIFQGLKILYLSHLHADHHLGMISIIKKWYQINKKSTNLLHILVPRQYQKFIMDWLNIDGSEILHGSRLVFIHLESFLEESDVIYNNSQLPKATYNDIVEINKELETLGIESIKACKAIHCNWAYSSSITFKMGLPQYNLKNFKISYSGDTRPNYQDFANYIGYDSDLLIHEASMENELTKEAKMKRHSTINEAIQVSNAMNAKKLLLTHFSQRYPKVPQLNNNIQVEAREYCFAFDGMIINYDNMNEQEKLFSSLDRVFVDEKETEEQKEDVDHNDNKNNKRKKNDENNNECSNDKKKIISKKKKRKNNDNESL